MERSEKMASQTSLTQIVKIFFCTGIREKATKSKTQDSIKIILLIIKQACLTFQRANGNICCHFKYSSKTRDSFPLKQRTQKEKKTEKTAYKFCKFIVGKQLRHESDLDYAYRFFPHTWAIQTVQRCLSILICTKFSCSFLQAIYSICRQSAIVNSTFVFSRIVDQISNITHSLLFCCSIFFLHLFRPVCHHILFTSIIHYLLICFQLYSGGADKTQAK